MSTGAAYLRWKEDHRERYRTYHRLWQRNYRKLEKEKGPTSAKRRRWAREGSRRFRAKHGDERRTYNRDWMRHRRMMSRLWECLLWFPVEVEG